MTMANTAFALKTTAGDEALWNMLIPTWKSPRLNVMPISPLKPNVSQSLIVSFSPLLR